MINEKIEKALYKQVEIIDEMLTRYTEDEAGQDQKTKYKKMMLSDKINLLTNTLFTCSNWCDFETDIIINFDYNNY